MNRINIILEAYSIVISALLMLCVIVCRDYKTRQGRLFLGMLSMNIMVLASDIVTWIFDAQPRFNTLLTAANFFVYSFSYIFVALFTTYLIVCIERKRAIRYSKLFLNIVYLACAIAIILLIISLFNHMYFYLDERGYYIRGPLYPVTLVFSICVVFINTGMVFAHRETLGLRDTLALMSYGLLPVIAMILRIFLKDVTFLFSASTLSMFITYIYIQSEQRRLLYKKERELAESRIELMISQIQPHFIFNTLNSIRELIYSDTGKADQMVVNFSNYLRANITALQGTSISFEDELKNVDIYISIEKERFGDKIKFIKEIERSDFYLPPLIIQPLVENAVKHGICPKAEGGTIKLMQRAEGDFYKITIEDDGTGFDPAEKKTESVGIENVKMRVKYLLGTDLKVESEPGSGTRIEISVPKNYSGEVSAQ